MTDPAPPPSGSSPNTTPPTRRTTPADDPAAPVLGPGGSVYVQPMFTLKSVMDAGHPMRVTPPTTPTPAGGGCEKPHRDKDYYKILGLTQAATPAEVKKAYRKLARKHHPDRNPGDPQAAARFIEIAEAYETLADPERRQAYDRTYNPPRHAGHTGAPRRRRSSRRSAHCLRSWKTSGPRSAATTPRSRRSSSSSPAAPAASRPSGATTPPAGGTTAAPSTPKS